ncbi:MAG TPA: penicillin acylase family protein [Micromonosporaceae bacterium]
MRRRLLTLITALLLPAGLVVGAAPASAVAGQPTPVSGLLAAASVTRDVDGIAHIRATNEHDLFFLQGWVHASDRLFQMDVTRRQASGTLAELLGQAALPGDVEVRTIGLRRAAERSLPVQSRAGQRALQAYAAGVNTWVASHDLPAQYAALGLTRVAPWTPVDSLVIGKAIAFGLSFDLDIELTLVALTYQAAGAAAGFDGNALFRDDLFRTQPFSDASTVPDATAQRIDGGGPGTGASRKVPNAALRLAEDYRARADTVPFLAQAADRSFALGSNEWVISGRHTATGRPILANDPHLALDTPSTFYPVALRAGRFDVQGEGFAGTPYVILGQNRRVAWGATTNPMDVTDTYIERVRPDPTSPSGLSTVHRGQLEHVVAIPETFRVNLRTPGQPDSVAPVPPGSGVPAATLIVPRRNNGPIIALDQGAGMALSVQYSGFSPTRELDTFRMFNQAENLEDFRKALTYFDVGSQNWAYADVDGRIGYFTSAEMPLREDLEAGTVRGLPPYLLRDGTGGNEWLPARTRHPGQALPYEILPPAEMPHLIDPAAGFFVNANNDPAGTTLDNDPLNQLRPTGGTYYLNVGYDGFRGGRITDLVREAIGHGEKLTVQDVKDQQADVTLLDAQFFTPYLVDALDRAKRSDTPELAALAGDPRILQAVGRLARWDHTTPTGIPEGYDAADVNGRPGAPSAEEVADSVAATIYSVWRGQFIKNVIDAHISRYGLQPPGGDEAMKALKTLLLRFDERHGVGLSGVDFFAVPGVGDPAERRDVLLLKSLGDALALLAGPAFDAAFHGSTNQDDYRWGKLHRVVFDAVLGEPWSVPPAGGGFPAPLPGLAGVPTDGGFNTVDASSHNARADSVNEFRFGGGPVRRFVAQPVSGGMSADSALPGGTSETLGSPYYGNLLPGWLTNETYPVRLRQDDLARATASVFDVVPA